MNATHLTPLQMTAEVKDKIAQDFRAMLDVDPNVRVLWARQALGTPGDFGCMRFEPSPSVFLMIATGPHSEVEQQILRLLDRVVRP